MARAAHVLHRLEDTMLALLLLALLGVATAQILLRLVFDSGLAWAEPVGRAGVLWIALLGAVGAAREGKHIAIDALTRQLPPHWARASWSISQLATAGVCALLAWQGARMVVMEREAGTLFVAQVPNWWPMLAFPLAFALMAGRFLRAALSPPTIDAP